MTQTEPKSTRFDGEDERTCSNCGSESTHETADGIRCTYCWSKVNRFGRAIPEEDSRPAHEERKCTRCGWQPIELDIGHPGTVFCSNCGVAFPYDAPSRMKG